MTGTLEMYYNIALPSPTQEFNNDSFMKAIIPIYALYNDFLQNCEG